MGLWKKRLIEPPAIISAQMHLILAEEDDEQIAPEVFDVPETLHALFSEKVFLYRQVLVLFALVIAAGRQPIFDAVLKEYEAIVISDPANTTAGFERRAAVESAMRDLSRGLDPKNRNFVSWSRDWFAAIGYDNPNPVLLSLFYFYWSRHLVAAHNAIAKMAR